MSNQKIYGTRELEGILIFSGDFPAGKILDVRATETAMYADLVDRIVDECGEAPDCSTDDSEYDDYLSSKNAVSERIMSDETWYASNYVWIDT